MRLLLSSILIFCFLFSVGQELSTSNKKARRLFEKAQEAYRSGDNSNAIVFLEEAILEDSCFFESHLLAADIYAESDSVLLQIKSLEKAAEIDVSRYPKIFYILGNAYFQIGNYHLAKAAYQHFIDKNLNTHPFYSKAVERIEQCTFAISLIENPVAFQVEDMGGTINTKFDEYWPSLTIDGKTLIFTRLTTSVVPESQIAAKRLQEDFYSSGLMDSSWQAAQPMIEINTPSNEGAQSISADGKLIFFTACSRSDGFGSCDIYFTQKINGNWTKPRNVGSPINTAGWESQPAISANGRYLYFVSNRTGGKGGMDIWKCKLIEISHEGFLHWGKPQNLGDSINTIGNEMSPFIHADGKTLYFASDKWPGMGGLDIFYAHQINDSLWSHSKNLGYPINTFKDEQGLIVEASGEMAYYSSDRPGSLGMDIYRFNLYSEARPTPVSYIKGKVIDEVDNVPLSAHVELINVNDPLSVTQIESSVDSGDFLISLPLGNEYAFNVWKEGYLFFSENFSLKEVHEATDPFVMEIFMKRIEIGNTAILRNIFFNTDSYEILDTSKAELQRLFTFLESNPTVQIEIGGHTDNVGSEDYNMDLSEKRAAAVYHFLVDRGIKPDRLLFKGYGFGKPVDKNKTAAGRAKNRRTEFRVIAIK